MSSHIKKKVVKNLKDNLSKAINIVPEQLPLCCPTPEMVVWSSHPRVYLDIEGTVDGKLVCPYCSTKYTLKNLE